MAILSGFEVAIVVDDKDLMDYVAPETNLDICQRQMSQNIAVPSSRKQSVASKKNQAQNSKSKSDRPTNRSHARAQKHNALTQKRTRSQLEHSPLPNLIKGTRKAKYLVEASAGQEFAIRFSSSASFSAGTPVSGIEAIVSTDGRDVSSEFLDKKPFEGSSTGRIRYRHKECYVEPYRFSKIRIDEDIVVSPEELFQLKTKYRAMGTIRVRIFRVRSFIQLAQYGDNVLHEAQLSANNLSYYKQIKETIIPEKVTKGRWSSHRAVFDQSRQVDEYELLRGSFIDSPYQPYLTFEFHCVSRAMLQSLQLVPRDPLPVPLSERPEEELTREEMLQLLQQQKEEIVAYKKVKHETDELMQAKRDRSTTSNEDLSTVRPSKAQRCLTNGDIVDLTQD